MLRGAGTPRRRRQEEPQPSFQWSEDLPPCYAATIGLPVELHSTRWPSPFLRKHPDMTIRLHHGDLPAGIDFGPAVAIDTETLGLNPLRDRLCLVQLSRGDGTATSSRSRAGPSRRRGWRR